MFEAIVMKMVIDELIRTRSAIENNVIVNNGINKVLCLNLCGINIFCINLNIFCLTQTEVVV